MEDVESKYVKNGILINLLGIEDQETLSEIERKITTFKLLKLFEDPGIQTFDINHYQRIHHYLFSDIYPFAGKIRTEEISKKIFFCRIDYIYKNLNETLNKAKYAIPLLDTPDKLFSFILPLYADLDIVHPFREGNGRTLREFIRQYMEHVCIVNNFSEIYYFDYGEIDKGEYINAIVKADAYCQYDDLRAALNKCLKSKKNNKYEQYKRKQ